MAEFNLSNLFDFLISPEYSKIVRIGWDTVDGLTISTIYAYDISQYETAIIDFSGAHPVERYDTKENAAEGHARWVAVSPYILFIEKLGYGDIIPGCKIVLIRNFPESIDLCENS
jgi:hypothetical protein